MSSLSLAYPWLLDAYPELFGGTLGTPLAGHLGSTLWGSFDSLCPMAYPLPESPCLAACLLPG